MGTSIQKTKVSSKDKRRTKRERERERINRVGMKDKNCSGRAVRIFINVICSFCHSFIITFSYGPMRTLIHKS